ncbi:helix-turn-helix transcriptional regulator [Streptomyces sp. ODS28]|uniref:helix-turn-helix domain-containing protein n=1 Tax=Streptomyces sp. ODS28 TaxID=3136688 RepID=UPI0031E61651
MTELELPEPSSFVKGFGKQMKRLREGRSMSRGKLGELVGFAESTIGAFERGERIADAATACAIDRALDAGGVLACVGDELERQRYPKRFGQFFQLEAQALSLNSYATQTVHGLLQTEAYARAVLRVSIPYRDEDEVERLVSERLARQALLSRRPIPYLCFVVDEAVLRRRTGGHGVARGQLQHLLDVGQLHNVQVLVFPLDCEDPVCAPGSVTLLELPDKRMLGYAEVQEESILVSDKDEASAWMHRFGLVLARALPPAHSASLIKRLMEEI